MQTDKIKALDNIIALTGTYARARAELSDRVTALEDELTRVKRSRIRGIKGSAARAQEAQAAIVAAIEAAPGGLFTRPRTIVVEGIRVGLTKEKGKVHIADEESTLKLIRKHLPDEADTLIKTKETPIKPALANLPAATLRRLGVTLTETTDTPLVKPQDSEIDKLVDRIIGDPAATEEEA